MDDVNPAEFPRYGTGALPTYQEIIAADARPGSAVFRECSMVDVDFPRVPRERYTSKAFFDLEVERMWSRVWQIACREEQIPEIGDCVLYESPGASLIVTRSSETEIKAYYNTCLHRGMRLCATDTSVQQFRCPYHGFTWNLDGALVKVPAKWDFPHLDAAEFSLPQARVGIWGGFVFVNRDPDAPSLESYLANLPAHFAGWPRDEVYLATNVRKVIKANWKACIEGFVEAFHVAELHSQALPFGGDMSTQYDVWPGNENISRFLEPSGIPCDEYPEPQTQQEILDRMIGAMAGATAPTLPDGGTARAAAAELARVAMSKLDGRDYSWMSDTEALDPAQYSIFPNIVLFRSLGYPFAYRFVPVRDDPNNTVFDFWMFRPKPTDGSPIPEVNLIDLGPDDLYSECGAFPPWLGRIYDQDASGFPQLQEGLRSGATTPLILSRYQEVRVRLLHQTLSRYIAEPPPRK
jgi:nitrite reductase/ring-hydroxylating ferredoxin subunit